MNKFTSVITIKLVGNELTAKNKADYIKKMTIKMYHELGLELDSNSFSLDSFEILEIKEVDDNE